MCIYVDIITIDMYNVLILAIAGFITPLLEYM